MPKNSLAVFSCWGCVQWLKEIPTVNGRNRRKRVKSGSRSYLFDPFRILLKKLALTTISMPLQNLQSIELILTKPRSRFQFKSLYHRSRFWMTHCRLLCVWSCRPCHASTWSASGQGKHGMVLICFDLVSVTLKAAKATKVYALLTFHVRQMLLHVFCLPVVFRHWIGINFMPLLGFCAHARWSSREEALKCI